MKLRKGDVFILENEIWKPEVFQFEVVKLLESDGEYQRDCMIQMKWKNVGQKDYNEDLTAYGEETVQGWFDNGYAEVINIYKAQFDDGLFEL